MTYLIFYRVEVKYHFSKTHKLMQTSINYNNPNFTHTNDEVMRYLSKIIND